MYLIMNYMILDEIIDIHSSLIKKGIFPKRVYMNKRQLERLQDELERQVMYIHNLSIVVTTKTGIWCE